MTDQTNPPAYPPTYSAPTYPAPTPPPSQFTARDDSADSSPSATDKAGDAAQAGKQAAADVASTATDKAKDVAAETKHQARQVMRSAQDEFGAHARTQQQSLVTNLRSLGDELTSMAQHTDQPGMASDLARQAGSRAHGAASWLDSREPGDLVEELRGLARRRPGAFLLGALAAGVLAGRLTRGAVAVHSDDSDDSTASTGSTASTPNGASVGQQQPHMAQPVADPIDRPLGQHSASNEWPS